MKKYDTQQGFSATAVFIICLVFAGLGLVGWYVYHTANNSERSEDISSNSAVKERQGQASKWVSITTQGGAFSMKAPDGWKLTNYPGDFIGGRDIVYQEGVRAQIKGSDEAYSGHLLDFRVSIVPLDDAGLGPQWDSPQPNLEESTTDFVIGSLQGKRYKGVFSGDPNQTIYQYVFELNDSKKLEAVYTVRHEDGIKDDITVVEEAIKTIKFVE
jgi:hypothetical protein